MEPFLSFPFLFSFPHYPKGNPSDRPERGRESGGKEHAKHAMAGGTHGAPQLLQSAAQKTSQGKTRRGEGFGNPSLKGDRYLGAPVYRCWAAAAAPRSLSVSGAAAGYPWPSLLASGIHPPPPATPPGALPSARASVERPRCHPRRWDLPLRGRRPHDASLRRGTHERRVFPEVQPRRRGRQCSGRGRWHEGSFLGGKRGCLSW